MNSTQPTHQIETYLLINFQSWPSTEQPIRLETDIVNNIQGSNETGKSVLFKVLYAMYFPGYHELSELLRDGAEFGIMFIALTDGSQLIFECHPSYRKFYLEIPGQAMKEWQQTEVPDEITDALGFIVNYEHQIILNVIDSDIPLPFIKTSPKYNAALLKSLIEPDQIKGFYENCQAYLLEIATAKSKFDRQASNYLSKFQALEFVDIFLLKEERQALQDTSNILSALIEHFNHGVNIFEVIQNPPHMVKDVCSIAEPYMRAIAPIKTTGLAVQELKRLKATAPPPIIENPSTALKYIACESTLNTIQSLGKKLDALYLKPPRNVDCPADIGAYIKATAECEQLHSLGSKISKLSYKQSLCEKLVAVTRQDVTNLESTLGVCPTCGREFNVKDNCCSGAASLG